MWLRMAHQPTYKGNVTLEGIAEDVDVYFDEYGIPHISAQSGEDAYRALGYVHAQERLFQMDLTRRIGLGELSELMGESTLSVDKLFRTLGTRNHAKRSANLARESGGQSEWVTYIDAYLDGVNAYINHGKKPIEYRLLGQDVRPFVLEDMYGTIGYMAFSFAMSLKTEPLLTFIQQQLDSSYLEIFSVEPFDSHFAIPVSPPERTEDGQIISDIHSIMDIMPTAPFLGSNSWVVGANKSASGKVLFCNDTHIGFSQPSVWYETHLTYPGYDLYGNHLAGIPFPLIGHSLYHSFGLTMFENDDFDLYVETLADDEDYVIVGDTVESIVTLQDTINIKGGDIKVLSIRSTARGHIINDVLPELSEITDSPVTAWWTYLKQESKALEAIYKMTHANDINEFESGVRLLHAPGLNVMYGDADDNIAWWAAAQLFQRPEGMPSKFLIDASKGWEADIEWLPFEENPMAINPEAGFIYSANNRPDTTITGRAIPGYYYPGDRGRVIHDFIDSREKLTIDDMKTLLLHTQNPGHERNAKTMVEAVVAPDHPHKALLDTLLQWDGNHHLQSTAPTIYYKWLYHSLRLKMADEIGEDWFERYVSTFLFYRSLEGQFADEHTPWWDDVTTNDVESRSDILNEALKITVEELQEQWGKQPSAWEWSRAISLEHAHPFGSRKPLDRWFNVGPLPVEGNLGSVNKLAFSLNGEGIYKVSSGPAMRTIVDFADVDQSESINPTGQSGNIFSPYYKDQAEMFVKGQFRPQLMDIETIKKSKHSHLVIKGAE